MKKYLFALIPLFSICSGWAMDEEAPASDRRTLLQFKARSEADIVGLTKRLMNEAAPSSQPMLVPPNFEQLEMDQQLEWWVNRQCNPSDQTRFDRIFRLIEEANRPPMFIDSTEQVIPETSLRELDVLVGSGSDDQHRTHSLIHQIDRTKLGIGAAVLARHLVQVKKTDALQNLQSVIGTLNHVKEGVPLRQTMQRHLDSISSIEDNFLSFWVNQEEQDALEETLKESAFKKLPFSQEANSNPFIVGTQQRTELVMPVITPITSIGFGVGACVGTGGNPFAVGLAVISISLSLKNIPYSYKNSKFKIKAFKNSKFKIKALYLMQRKLIGLSSFIKKLNNMHRLLVDDGNFPQALIDSLALPTVTPEMKKLTKLLDTNTFKDEPSFWSHWGKICVAYRLMLQKRSE